ncbi:MAG: hypothetical protein HYX75_20835 [Acidobacteria bacterium]|nr:hypothetical protein [Acidobacteriota bacterium]
MAADAPALDCIFCHVPLLPAFTAESLLAECPACHAPLTLAAFPALYHQQVVGEVGEPVVMDTESSCFYHPQKRAAVPCDDCGRFLCTLCEVVISDRHLCPACIEGSRKKGDLKDIESSRILYDNIALALAIWPMLIFYFTVVTAPIAVFVAIRYWKAPTSILKRTKLRFIAAIGIGVLQMVAWGAVIVTLASKF